MFEQRIEIADGQCLTLAWMASNVSVTGWEEPHVLLRLRDGGEQDLTVEDTAEGPAVSARVACEVNTPRHLAVKVREAKANLQVSSILRLEAEQVRGNLKVDEIGEASLAEVYGNLRAQGLASLSVVGTVFGDATLKEVGVADVQNVRGNLVAKSLSQVRASRTGGNLVAKEVDGKLEADQVGGNASLKDVGGPTTLNQVAGNLTATNLAGGAKVAKIGGNLVLNGQIATGCTYQLSARGNASLRLPEGTSAHLTLAAKGKLLCSVELAEEQREGNRLTGILGDGGAEVVVEAGGNLVMGGDRAEPRSGGADLAEEVSRQIEESLQGLDLEAIGRQVSEEMESALSRLQVKLESVDWERMGVQTQRAVERAMEQMQRNMDRMVDKAARHQEKLERKLEREQRRWARSAEAGRGKVDLETEGGRLEPAAEAAASAGVDLDAERLSILRMVEQGQIAPEEAEMLLDALEE
jgi:hypothetical protein